MTYARTADVAPRLMTLACLMFSVTAGEANVTARDIPRQGLVLWLNAEDAVVEGGTVTTIRDHSDVGNHAKRDVVAKSVAANPAIIRPEGRAPVLRFDGSPCGYSFTAIADIRSAILVVAKDPSAFKKREELFVLGGRATRDFHVGTHFTDTLIEAGGNASPHLKQAAGWFNGIPITPTTAEFAPRLAVITLVSTGNVSADQLARDRTFLDRSWKGDIAEVLLYNRPLSEDERQTLERFLLARHQITPFPPTLAEAVSPEKANPLK